VIDHSEIRQIASAWTVPEETIEKDYVLGWLLWGIARHPPLYRSLVFRGGTCLKKCYVDTHRFSEDLDFALFPAASLSPESLQSHLPFALSVASQESGIDFSVRDPSYDVSTDRPSVHAKVYFRGPRATPTPIALKVDIELAEPLIRPPVLRTIGHPYSDTLAPPDSIYCYGLEELFGEKLRALGDRYRPRDLYDAIYLFRRADVHAEADLVSEVLSAKCLAKDIPLPSLDRLQAPQCIAELREHWPHMLGHQLGQLPSFDDYFGELERMFAWLDGTPLPADDLLPIEADEAWAPPPIEWHPGQHDRLEPVRFAAVNRLCVDLGYGGDRRLIEPYSLRRTAAGNVLLYALRSDTKALRAYRIDRIQSIAVTSTNFKPSLRVEFSPEGRLSAPPTSRGRGFLAPLGPRSRRSPAAFGSGPTYVVRCTLCGKTFRRKSYDVRLKPHKHSRSHIACPGSIAIYVTTEW